MRGSKVQLTELRLYINVWPGEISKYGWEEPDKDHLHMNSEKHYGIEIDGTNTFYVSLKASKFTPEEMPEICEPQNSIPSL